MGFFRKKLTDKDHNNFYDQSSFHLYWKKTAQPDLAGARAYAYQTLMLPPVSPFGTGIIPSRPYKRTQGNLYVLPTKNLQGIATSAGQMFAQPLYDPAVGYTSSLKQPISPLVQLNIPVSINKAIGRNDPSPASIR